MTDLERFAAQEGREDLIADVRRRIDAEGITYIYYQFVSVTGRIMGKGVPAPHWETIARKGFQLVYGSTANLFIDRRGDYIGYGPEARELIGLPDVDTFCPLPWDPRMARVFCTLFRGREEEVDGGAFLTSDCRGNLHRIHDAFTAATGLEMRIGCEPEMMWLKTDAEGKPTVEGMTKPYCYHIDQFSELQPLIHKVLEYGEQDGARHDPGRSRGRAGTARAELAIRQGRAHGRPADHLPPDLSSGRPRARRLPLLHAQAVHGGVSQRLPPQLLALARRGEHVPARTPTTRGCQESRACAPSPACSSTSPRCARSRLRPSTPTAASPTPASGRPSFADWGFQNRTTALRISAPGPVRVPVGRLRGQPVPVDGGPDHGDQGRYRPEPRSRGSPRSATSTRPSRRARK